MIPHFRLVVGIGLLSLSVGTNQVVAAAYAFAGLSVSNFTVFWKDSVADPTVLSQGPNRDGTGAQIDPDDFGNGFGGGTGGGRRVSFERTQIFGGSGNDPTQACVGDCSKGQNDFSRPPLLPAVPSGDAHFARADWRQTNSLVDMVAEMRLELAPIQNQSEAYGVSQQFRLFEAVSARAMVVDFDVDQHLRTLNGLAAPDTMLTAKSDFQVTLRSGTENIFRFSPSASGDGNLGGTVISAPFALNQALTALNPHPLQDKEVTRTGQFRVITPELVPGRSYVLEVEQWVGIVATNVPEPQDGHFVCIAIGTCAGGWVRRKRESKQRWS
jgi:hypothetical protein